ncbi:transcription factor bHLH19-like [Cucurbita pepo subsp. pepo]|uniref:transcription factor bHLH19-like n=1 Tax=Cucurbita pepo subsp. pepo TaxID=3664 RepID=UPI000C9D28BB|nr:transcription factor bHLH19-like [Cucurbita pepo subsp. pepo]
MEISSTKWVSEWEMEDAPYFMDEFQVNPFEFSFDEMKFEENGRSDFYGSTDLPSAVKVEGKGATSQGFAPKADSSSSSSHIISFDKLNCKAGKGCDVKGSVEPKIEMAYESDGNLNFSTLITESWNNEYSRQGAKKAAGSVNRNPFHAREHVLAERKRREKLSQRFIALSALIPGLNKIDKASILGGAVRYVKELQERLKVVEEQAAISKVSEEQSTVYVKRRSPASSSDDDDTISSEENSFSGRPVPEIEARVSNKDVLIRIHCHKRKGCLSYLLGKIENLNLTILNSSALPFAHSKLDITIVAQVDDGFCMKVEDVVKNLRQALLDFN